MMTPNARKFDDWIRSAFCQMNTELEERYFAQDDRNQVEGIGNDIKAALCREGQALIADLVREGNTDEGFEQGFNLLGNVGFYMAACSRHAISEAVAGPAARQREASSLAMELGASLGVTPRFATSHLTTHNLAIDGRYKTFTTLADEYIFVDYNTIGILAYKRAADALLRILPLGVSHPITARLLNTAKDALDEVIDSNQALFAKLDIDRFFFNVRPYYKPHQVGFNTYRGANAGDFAGINVIDLLLGLCQSNQSSYSQLLVDKFLYMMPQDQLILRDTMRQQSLMNQFMAALDAQQQQAPWFKPNASAFLAVLEAHGTGASQHHDQLVGKYIKQPADRIPEANHGNLTASGPPLPVLLAALEKLRDQRRAAQRDDIVTRYADVQRLKAAVESGAD
ncbi:monodechloroaminopyrrolnitrin synthase PrnB family protein [Chitinimonas sp.]|uniref:PrnB family protein n=1 Tax=Chitinimonas sp. TaxID=1934313 RepID=UPI0035AD9CC0